MRIEVYVDILFLVNFAMNLLIFFISLAIRRKQLRWLRLICGAAVSAAVYCLLLFSPWVWMLGMVSGLLILGAGLIIAARFWSVMDFLLTLAVVYAAAFGVQGAAVAMANSLSPNVLGASFGLGDFSAAHLLVASAMSFGGIKLGQKYILCKLINRQSFCAVKVFMDGKSCVVNALIDSGNSLVEPISQSPVVIAEFEKIQSILPQEFQRLYQNKQQDELESVILSASTGIMASRIRMIPFSALGNRDGIIIGFRPDKIEIMSNTQTQKPMQGIIGICDFALAADGSYHALMNPAIL